MHFYPGVAEYAEPDRNPYRVYLNEDTLRKMDPTFEGRPVYVMHVDGVEQSLDKLRGEVDGWVVRSFYNEIDGKHWCEFMIVSEKGLRAIKQGMRLSNAYMPLKFASGGLWNGVSYEKEVVEGEFEHLAIVPDPRYDESCIFTPEKFKEYNEAQSIELKRLANSKGKAQSMKLQLTKKVKVEKIENDLSDCFVLLPKSKTEISIDRLVADVDAMIMNDAPNLDPGGVASIKKAFGNEGLADPSHKVKLHDGSYCNVAELVEKHKMMSDEMDKMKKDAMESDTELEVGKKEEDVEGDNKSKNAEGKDMPHGDSNSDVEGGEKKENDDDSNLKAEEKDKEVEMEKKKNDLEEKKKRDKEKADRLRNAHLRADEPTAVVDLPEDKVARGKARYGS